MICVLIVMSMADVQAQVRIFQVKYSVAQVVLGVGGGNQSRYMASIE